MATALVPEQQNSPYAAVAGRKLDCPEASVEVTCLGCHAH